MDDSLDPYHKWLGISPKDQPPNHYRLLGIDLFESDPEVIQATFNRQRAHVLTYQRGAHAALAQQILQQIVAARLCLLDRAARQAYDDELRAALGMDDEAPATFAEPASFAELPERRSVTSDRAAGEPAAKRKNQAEPSTRLWFGIGQQGQLAIVGVGVVVILLTGVYMMIGGSSKSSKARPASESKDDKLVFPGLPALKRGK